MVLLNLVSIDATFYISIPSTETKEELPYFKCTFNCVCVFVCVCMNRRDGKYFAQFFGDFLKQKKRMKIIQISAVFYHFIHSVIGTAIKRKRENQQRNEKAIKMV